MEGKETQQVGGYQEEAVVSGGINTNSQKKEEVFIHWAEHV